MGVRGTGRRFALDYRDGDHMLRSVTPPRRPKRKTWYLQPRWDQGGRPWCVDYAWNGFLAAKPRQLKPLPFGEIYRAAQDADEWPGNSYAGTSVRAGAKILVEKKRVKEYRFAFSAEDVLDAVGSLGPAVMGTDWLSDMARPTPEGIIRFSGAHRGGHAYLVLGYNDARGLALVHNSWGPSWGINGRAWLPYEDLEAAIREAGEACMALEVPR